MKLKTTLLAGVIATGTVHAGGLVEDGVGLQQAGGNARGGFLNVSDNSLPQLSAGTQELGVGGSLDLSDGIAWDLNLTYGWFVSQGWEVGFTVDWAGEDGSLLENSRFGLFTEYNFATGSKWVPYVGVGASYAATGDTAGAGGSEGIAYTGELGIKYFLRSTMAIYGGVNFSWSPDDVFGIGDEIGSNLTNIEIGMRFYF